MDNEEFEKWLEQKNRAIILTEDQIRQIERLFNNKPINDSFKDIDRLIAEMIESKKNNT